MSSYNSELLKKVQKVDLEMAKYFVAFCKEHNLLCYFCGGGSDLPSFYEEFGGCVLSTTIRKYMYLTLHNYFYKNQIVLKYSKTETVTDVNQKEHRYFKQCLTDFNIRGVEISSMADIPSGTGLESSSSFTVALLHLLYTYKGF